MIAKNEGIFYIVGTIRGRALVVWYNFTNGKKSQVLILANMIVIPSGIFVNLYDSYQAEFVLTLS